MLCPHCHTENTDTRTHCISCQKPLVAFAGVAATNSPEIALPASPKEISVTGAIAIMITVLLALLFALTRPVQSGTEGFTIGYRLGIFLGALLFPTLIAYLVAG